MRPGPRQFQEKKSFLRKKERLQKQTPQLSLTDQLWSTGSKNSSELKGGSLFFCLFLNHLFEQEDRKKEFPTRHNTENGQSTLGPSSSWLS